MAGKLYLDPKHPSGLSTLKGSMLQRDDGGWGNRENGTRHWMLTLGIAPFARDFRAILTRYII